MWEKNTSGGINLTAGKISQERRKGIHDMACERELVNPPKRWQELAK